MRLFFAVLLFLSSGHGAFACYERAANAYGIDPDLILAIAYMESRWQADAIGVNTNGSEDLCAMQINDQHLPRLSAYGINRTVLLTNLCACTFTGAWILSQELHREKSVWQAVASYHTGPRGKPERRDWYVANVRQIYLALKQQKSNAQ